MAKTLGICIGICLLSGLTVLGQEELSPLYYFDGDEVVFEFDIELHYELVEDKTGKKPDFEDLNIYEVALLGAFNDWNREGWKMEQVGEGLFRLRKKITDFDDNFQWEFKYFVNRKYWAEPGKKVHSVKTHDDRFWQDVFNERLYNIYPDPQGNARFFLNGNQSASKVILAGDFNGWDEQMLAMVRKDNGWELTLDLDPGYYEYKFIVDGNWRHDLHNPKKVENIHGTLNSILEVKEDIVFRLNGYPDAGEVVIAGSFNKWNEEALKMSRTDGGWEFALSLVGGKHYYKFIVDGKWMVDPFNPLKEYDGSGNLNSVLIVQ
ncbi:MAG: glycogen-binding domain-containing protein [Bacteroidota bacterium]